MIPIDKLQALPDKAIVERLDNLVTNEDGNPSNLLSVSDEAYLSSNQKLLVVGGRTNDSYVSLRLNDNYSLQVSDSSLNDSLNKLTNFLGNHTNKNKYSDSNLANLETTITNLTKDINDEVGRIIATNIIPTSYALGSPINYKVIITYYS
jgi:hypothetical protein